MVIPQENEKNLQHEFLWEFIDDCCKTATKTRSVSFHHFFPCSNSRHESQFQSAVNHVPCTVHCVYYAHPLVPYRCSTNLPLVGFGQRGILTRRKRSDVTQNLSSSSSLEMRHFHRSCLQEISVCVRERENKITSGRHPRSAAF